MAVPVLISASAGDWNLLREASGLPGGLFCDRPDPETDPTVIPLLCCGEIQSDPEKGTAEDLERIDEILFSCRNGHFIHLHRCAGSAEEEIEKIRTVSSSWDRISGQRKRRYESYIRPSMIIVGGDSTLGGATDFRRLLELIEK